MAAPAPVEECRLEDHLGTVTHGGKRLGFGSPQLVGRPRFTGGDFVDAPAFGTETIEVCLLVLEAAAADQLELWIRPERLRQLTVECLQLERREMVAGKVSNEVRGTDDEAAVRGDLHASNHTCGR